MTEFSPTRKAPRLPDAGKRHFTGHLRSTDTDMQTNAGVDSNFNYNTTDFTNVKIQKRGVSSNLPAGGNDTGFDDFVWYRPDINNTCCLGPKCIPLGFIINGTRAGLGNAR
jgi:hypothetical protein